MTTEYLQDHLPLSTQFLQSSCCLDSSHLTTAKAERYKMSFWLILTKLPQPLSVYEVSEAVDQWKMLALDSTPSEWKCDSGRAHPAIDEVWRHVLSRRNAVGNLKYCTLGKVVKACLAFPHGNADAERSFSANKNTVRAERSCLREDTVTAIRLIKDGMRHSGKSASNIEVTNDISLILRGHF